MDWIILIVAIWFGTSVIAKILRYVMKPENVAIWVISFILMMIPHYGWLGILVLVWRYIVIPVGRYHERHPSAGISNSTIMWLIPIFWPFLIFSMFLSGENEKTDTSYSDYLEHKRRNAK
jgi:hypothetical protein